MRGLLDQRPPLPRHRVDGEPRDVALRGLGQRFALVSVAHEVGHRGGERLAIAVRDERARFAVPDDLGRAERAVERDDRHARRHRFDDDDAPALVARGQDEDVRRLDPAAGHLRHAGQLDAVAEAEPVALRLKRLQQLALAPDRQRPVRVIRRDDREGVDQAVEALLLHEPPDPDDPAAAAPGRPAFGQLHRVGDDPFARAQALRQGGGRALRHADERVGPGVGARPRPAPVAVEPLHLRVVALRHDDRHAEPPGGEHRHHVGLGQEADDHVGLDRPEDAAQGGDPFGDPGERAPERPGAGRQRQLHQIDARMEREIRGRARVLERDQRDVLAPLGPVVGDRGDDPLASARAQRGKHEYDFRQDDGSHAPGRTGPARLRTSHRSAAGRTPPMD